MSEFSFPSNERLKSRKLIAELFDSGNAEKSYPVIAIWKKVDFEEDVYIQAGFSVSKRNFKRAVDRNRHKRLMREAFRLQRSPLMAELETKRLNLAVIWLYVGKDVGDYHQIEKKINLILTRLKDKVVN